MIVLFWRFLGDASLIMVCGYGSAQNLMEGPPPCYKCRVVDIGVMWKEHDCRFALGEANVFCWIMYIVFVMGWHLTAWLVIVFIHSCDNIHLLVSRPYTVFIGNTEKHGSERDDGESDNYKGAYEQNTCSWGRKQYGTQKLL